MTEIEYRVAYDESGRHMQLAELGVYGHAGYDAGGRDIVCAAISMTVEMLEAALKRENGVKTLCEKEPGRFWLRCEADGPAGERAGAMLDMAALGLEMLAKAYPENVTYG